MLLFGRRVHAIDLMEEHVVGLIWTHSGMIQIIRLLLRDLRLLAIRQFGLTTDCPATF